MIFFSATDPGGARAIIPVLQELKKEPMQFCLMDEGVLSRESDPSIRRISFSSVDKKETFLDFLQSEGVGLVCIGTAVKKRLPIHHSRWASHLGIPTVAVLDNWMNYRQRFVLPNEGVDFPDHYFVMDQLAYDEALIDGVPPEILEITGHPGLATLAIEAESCEQDRSLGHASKQVVFVSEPAAQDQGAHGGVGSYRGYTEFDVLRYLADVMGREGPGFEVLIVPHPREDREALHSFCSGLFPPSVEWGLSPHCRGRDAILNADGVIGMTSILLYEAWLLGLPTISLQPGLGGGGASHFKRREGCCCVTKAEDIPSALDAWLSGVSRRSNTRICVRSDLEMHRLAPELIARRLREIYADSGTPCRERSTGNAASQ